MRRITWRKVIVGLFVAVALVFVGPRVWGWLNATQPANETQITATVDPPLTVQDSYDKTRVRIALDVPETDVAKVGDIAYAFADECNVSGSVPEQITVWVRVDLYQQNADVDATCHSWPDEKHVTRTVILRMIEFAAVGSGLILGFIRLFSPKPGPSRRQRRREGEALQCHIRLQGAIHDAIYELTGDRSVATDAANLVELMHVGPNGPTAARIKFMTALNGLYSQRAQTIEWFRKETPVGRGLFAEVEKNVASRNIRK